MRLAWLVASVASMAACSGGLQQGNVLADSCGFGNVEDGGICYPSTRQGDDAGTSADAAVTDAAVTDAAVTDVTQSDQDAALHCGPGTHEASGSCLPNDAGAPEAGLSCGPGTYEDPVGHQCLANPNDAGAASDSGLAYYDLRVPVTTIGADGYSKIPVLALGRLADGGPSQEGVLFGFSRPGAGSVTPTATNLAPAGSTLQFVPCNGTSTPSCLGLFEITMSLGTAPTVIVARSPTLNLVAPTGVGSTAQCLGGGNVIYFDGDATNYIHPGTETIASASISIASSPNGAPTLVTVSTGPSKYYTLNFSTVRLGSPIATTVYNNTQRFPFEDTGRPGLSIYGDGRGCNTESGSYQVEELVITNGAVTSFTATFEDHCEGLPAALRGCVHIGP